MGFISLSILSSVSVVLDGSRSTFSLSVRSFRTAANVAHVALLSGTDSSIVVETWHATFCMESFDLQLAKLDEEVGDEIFKDIAAL